MVIYIEDTADNDDTGGIRVSLYFMKNIIGKTTYEVTRVLQDKFGNNTSIVSIGPAGEKGYLTSCLCITDIDGKPTRQAGRGGLGAVFGSKGIKAMVVKNPKDSKVTYVDKDKFTENVKEFLDILKNQKLLPRSCLIMLPI